MLFLHQLDGCIFTGEDKLKFIKITQELRTMIAGVLIFLYFLIFPKVLRDPDGYLARAIRWSILNLLCITFSFAALLLASSLFNFKWINYVFEILEKLAPKSMPHLGEPVLVMLNIAQIYSALALIYVVTSTVWIFSSANKKVWIRSFSFNNKVMELVMNGFLIAGALAFGTGPTIVRVVIYFVYSRYLARKIRSSSNSAVKSLAEPTKNLDLVKTAVVDKLLLPIES